jgi:ribosomal protein S18 acetylase RimI-like enzyme
MDKHYIKLIHTPDQHAREVFEFSPAHIHIDILPVAQRKGWGRKLMGKAMEELARYNSEMQGLWVGVDPRNEEGKKFYMKLGGRHLPTSHGEVYTLSFDDFKKSTLIM